MYNYKSSLAAGVLCACVALTYGCRGRLLKSGGLTCKDKQMIVDTHNQMRSNVASGHVRGQPSAANMLEMVWDEELSRKAQQWADQCVNAHDSNTARRVSRFAVGQNLATTWTSPRPNRLGSSPDFYTQIQAWFSEVYQYRGSFSHDTGHYSQLVWGETYLVGCGYSYSYDGSRYTKLYICNYGPGGNVLGHTPYSKGTPACSKSGTSFSRQFTALCAVRGAQNQACFQS